MPPVGREFRAQPGLQVDFRGKDPDELGKCGARHVGGLLRLNKLGTRRRKFGIGPRGVRAGPKLRVDLRCNRAQQDTGPTHAGLCGAYGFLRGSQGEARVGGGYSDFVMPCVFQCRLQYPTCCRAFSFSPR